MIGNSSAVYLLLPFAAGRLVSRRAFAIVLGVAVTAVALAAFYFTASTLYLGRLSLDLSLGRWFLAGTISGTLLGLLGHAAHHHRGLLYLLPAVLLLEPIATAAASIVGLGSGAPPDALLTAGLSEVGVGILALLLLHRRTRARQH